MIGQTVSDYKILEKLLTTFLNSRTPSGQVGEGGMSSARTTDACADLVRSGGQNCPRTLFVSGCNFEDPPSFWQRRGS